MLCVIQFLIIAATLVVQSSASPWDRNNNIREFDLEWQCEQFCERLKGKLIFNNSDSECTCTIAAKGKLDFNSNHLEHKLNDLGFNFKIIDERKSSIVKRDSPAERIKKILAERTQRDVPAEDISASGPKPEEQTEKIPIHERLHRLRSKLLMPKPEDGVITAPDNIVGAAPQEHKEEIVEQKIEPKVLKLSPKVSHKNDISEIKDNSILGQAPKEEPSKVNTAPESPPNRLDAIRAKLATLRKERPILVGNKLECNANEREKQVPDRIQELRDRIRMRLQNIRNKNLPNDDGHEK